MQAVFALVLSTVISAASAASGMLTHADDIVSLETTEGEPYLISLSEGETLVIAAPIDKGLDTPIVADVASNATLTLNAAVTARSVVKRGQGRMVVNAAMTLPDGLTAAGGVVSVCDASCLEDVAVFRFEDGTFEFAGNAAGGPQTMPCPLVCSVPKISGALDGIIDLKIESPLVVTNILLESGCIFKRGVAALSFSPASGESMTLTVSAGYGGDAGNMGNVSAADWRLPEGSKYGGFNILEGEVAVRGDASSCVDMSFTVNIGMKASGIRARPILSIDGVTADVGSANNGFLQCIWNGNAGQYADFVVSNGARVATKNFRCLSYGHTSVMIDGAEWTITRWLFPYGGANFRTEFRFVNGARVYADCSEAAVTTYGECGFAVSNSVFAKNASLKCYPVDTTGVDGYWVFGPGSTNAITGLLRKNTGKASRYELRFEGGIWKTDVLNWQPMRFLDATNVVMRTVCETGLVLQVDVDTLYAGRAISGPGGMAKTGAGALVFETQGTWTGSEKFSNRQGDWMETKLEDPVSLAFEGLLDVREGSAFVERGACRTGGAYRAGAGASIDFDGNVLGSGVKFSGAGTFANATVTNATIFVPLGNDLVATDGSPTFDGVALNGTVFVDFGSGIEPLGRSRSVVVATFADPSAMPRSLAGWTPGVVAKGYGVFLSKSDDGRSVVARVEKLGLRLKLR